MTVSAPREPSEGVWFQRLGAPAIGNVCAALGLLIAIAAGVGLLRQGLFWLVFGYLTLIVVLVFVAGVARRRARTTRDLEAECSRLKNDVTQLGNALARNEGELKTAREEIEASEGGYSSLRSAVIEIARWGGSDVENYDDELANALCTLQRQPDRALREPRSGEAG
jgi:hypothetical protein